MTFQCNSVLRGLKKLTNNTDAGIAFLGNTTFFCLIEDDECLYDYHAYAHEIHSIISALEDDGYITYTTSEFCFCLTHKAIHSRQTFWAKVLDTLLRSVFLPIVVAFVTTLITLWLQSL